MQDENHYPFQVKALPYTYDALEPVIDAVTLGFHHDKHYQTYVDNLNKAIAPYLELHKLTVKELLMWVNELPREIQTSVRNNGGGVYNHELYFSSMARKEGQKPKGKLAEAIDRDFGSHEKWKEEMTNAALTQFGSGWAWLVKGHGDNLYLLQSCNQGVPNLKNTIPILLIDVWEHAYYLQYQNRRNEYVNGWFDIIDWNRAETRYMEK